MNLPIYIDNTGKDILILGKGPMQGLGEHSLTAVKMYSISFSKDNIKFCLSLHYNGANSYLFVNGTEIIKFKAKDSEIFLKTGQQIIWEKVALLVMFMILVLVMMLLMLMILKASTNI